MAHRQPHSVPAASSKPSASRRSRRLGPGPRSLRFDTLEERSLLAVFSVTNLNDAGPGSLRQAIVDSNAATTADEVVFDAAVVGTINLTSALPTIDDRLTITGPGAELLTIDASGGTAFRIFDIQFEIVAISGVTLSGGNANNGAAIRAAQYASLAIRDCVITGNTGAAVFAADSGGSIERTAIRENSGIGLALRSSLFTIADSTISGNSGRGIDAIGAVIEDGNYAFAVFSQAEVNNSTISGNAGGGVHVDYNAELSLESSTLSGNAGGGISTGNSSTAFDYVYDPVVKSVNSIIANNTNGGSPSDVAGEILANYSLIESDLGAVIIGSDNLVGEDPHLDALRDNGGPTHTHALLAGSPAIDAGSALLLDGYDANNFSAYYNFVDVFSSANNNPQVADGVANLNVDTGAGAFVWNQGETLKDVGDTARVDFGFNYPIATFGFATSSAGMALFDSVTGENLLAELRVETNKANSEGAFFQDGVRVTSLSGAPLGLMSLQVQIVATTASTVDISYQLSGEGFVRIGNTQTFNTSEVFFGPVAFDVSATESVHDNLVYGTTLPSGAFDQRGTPFNRIANGGVSQRIDLGAYERQAVDPALYIVTTVDDELDYSNDDVSLREAIGSANADPDPNVITFSPSLAGLTIDLDAGELEIQDSLTIDGSSLAAEITIDAASQSRIFHVTAATEEVILRGLTLTGGKAADGVDDGDGGDGGAIHSATTGQLTLEALSITGSRAGDGASPGPFSYLSGGRGGHGGAIAAAGDVLLIRSTISGNAAGAGGTPYDPFESGGAGGDGGGIHAAGNLSLVDSEVSGNSAGESGSGTFANQGGSGGGIRADGSISLTRSRVTGNRAGDGQSSFYNGGDGGNGGGIHAGGLVTLVADAVSGNTAGNAGNGGEGTGAQGGYGGDGGGILANGGVDLTDSTVGLNAAGDGGNGSGVPVAGRGGSGGGIRAFGGVTINQSTISGNAAGEGGDAGTNYGAKDFGRAGDGGIAGGVLAFGGLTVTNSTITGNTAGEGGTYTSNSSYDGEDGTGGGVVSISGNYNTDPLQISGSIIAGNTDFGTAPDVRQVGSGPLTVDFSLIGDTTGSGITAGTGTGNLLNIAPLLGPLQDNGGPTETHALLAGSPAINAGDPTAMVGVNGVPPFDQRGEGFARVSGGPIDMGSFEVQSTGFSAADFDEDGNVDGEDFLAWQANFGLTVGATKADGDADGDGDVDGSDFLIWQTQFGDRGGNGSHGGATDAACSPLRELALDAVFERVRTRRRL